MSNVKYKEYKEKNLCRRCGDTPLPGKTRCKFCHESHLNYQKEYKEKTINLGLCIYCIINKKEEKMLMCLECSKKHTLKQTILYAKYRTKVIDAYGGVCVCCKTTNRKYLQLDHINNDGAAHRKSLTKGGRGGSLYTWAYRNKFPNILQLLCANCHQAKTSHGGCTKEDHQ